MAHQGLERSDFNIMVPQAEAMGAIGAIRSLGQHGYTVYAVSHNEQALGLASNYASKSIVSPAYGDGYVQWLRDFVARENIQAIVHSEGFLLAVEDVFDEFQPLMCTPQQKHLAYLSMSKTETFSLFLNSEQARLRDHIPPTLIIDTAEGINWLEVADWPLPLFLKGDGAKSHDGQSSFVARLTSIKEAQACYERHRGQFSELLLQGCVKGAKATVNVVIRDGRVLAESMAVATHHNPHTGGLTSLRHTWWHEGMYQDALLRLKALNWEGAAMVEYAWCEQTQTYNFIELNARYWAALHLDLLAGLHFPLVQMDSFLRKTEPDNALRLTASIQARHTFPADYGYLLSLLKDNNVSVGKKLAAFAGFFGLMLNPRIKADLLYPGDRHLYWLNLRRFLSQSWRDLRAKF